MKTTRKVFILLLSLCMACVLFVACNSVGQEEKNKNPLKIKDGAGITLVVGETRTVDLSKYIDLRDTETSYAASSETDSVATTEVSGNVMTITALAVGKSDVTVSAKTVSTKFRVTVTDTGIASAVGTDGVESKPIVSYIYDRSAVTVAGTDTLSGRALTFKAAPKPGYAVTHITATVKGETVYTGEAQANGEYTIPASVLTDNAIVTIGLTDENPEGEYRVNYFNSTSTETPYSTRYFDESELADALDKESSSKFYQFNGWLAAVDGGFEEANVASLNGYSVAVDGEIAKYELNFYEDNTLKAGLDKAISDSIKLEISQSATTEDPDADAKYTKVKLLINGTISFDGETATWRELVAELIANDDAITALGMYLSADKKDVFDGTEILDKTSALRQAEHYPWDVDGDLVTWDDVRIGHNSSVSNSARKAYLYGYSWANRYGSMTKWFNIKEENLPDRYFTPWIVIESMGASNVYEGAHYRAGEPGTDVINGGFKTGDLTGWKVSGDGAGVSDKTTYWEGDANFKDQNGDTVQYFHQDGKYFLMTTDLGTPTLRSSTFVLAGDGIISFKLGTGNHGCYVALCDAEGKELIKVTNDYFDNPLLAQIMLRRFIDASEYIGQELYIKIVDIATADCGFITFDALKVSLTREEAQTIVDDDKAWAATYRQDVLDSNEGMGRDAKNIINAVRNYYAYELPNINKVQITLPIGNQRVAEGIIDVTLFLAEAEGSIFGTDSSKLIKSIVKVVGEEGYTAEADFDSLSLSEGTYTVTYRISVPGSDIYVDGTFVLTVVNKSRLIPNGDFEMGNLTGWTFIEGDENNVIVTSEKTYFAQDSNFFDQDGKTVQYFLQDGEYFLLSQEPGVTTIKSSNFTLGGDGIISFKLGAAKHDSYVALCDAETNDELILITNDYFNDPLLAEVMLRRFMYASDYIGQELYIKIVDNARDDFGLLTFDSLEVSLTMKAAKAIVDADKAWATTYRQDVLDSTATMGGRTKDIINAIRDYYSALTLIDITTVYLTQTISDKAVSAGSMDLTELLSEAKGSMLGVAANTLVKSIVKVNDGATDHTTGFGSFELEGGKTYTVTYRITDPASGKYAEATFTITVSSNYEILNGDFETGNLNGWTQTSGNGFAAVKSATTTDWNNGFQNGEYNQEGNYHLDGWAGANGEGGTGTLRSSTFTLGGSGKISFRLGGGIDKDGTYISVKKADGTEVARFTNTKQEAYNGGAGKGEQYMWLYVFDLTKVASLGDELYIEIVDNRVNDWGLLFVDDIRTYHTEDTFAALGTQGADYFEAVNQLN